MYVIGTIGQLGAALWILNVWILRFNKETEYRGGDAKNLPQEFDVYGFPKGTVYLVGGNKNFFSSAAHHRPLGRSNRQTCSSSTWSLNGWRYWNASSGRRPPQKSCARDQRLNSLHSRNRICLGPPTGGPRLHNFQRGKPQNTAEPL